ncbi:MAG: putative transcriptional regulator YdeE [Flammeovirgaceae bacterium]
MTQAGSTFVSNQKKELMEKKKVESFKVIGISVRTTNENNQGATDIGNLWNRFMAENIVSQIPNKLENSVFAIYTNYESDYTKAYDTVLGCKVSSFDTIPDGMIGHIVEGGDFSKFISKGKLFDGIVHKSWLEIWNTDLDRTYKSDYEVYGEKAQNPDNAEVEIFVGVK